MKSPKMVGGELRTRADCKEADRKTNGTEHPP
jgi:hypothetical protein